MTRAEPDPNEVRNRQDMILPPNRQGDANASEPPAPHTDPEGDEITTNTEPAWRAARALMKLRSETLLTVMLQPTFDLIQDTTLVPIYPCPHCCDGGLRTAGLLRLHKGIAFVRACDTCCAVEVGERQIHI
jgi:hypothetical protein